MKKIIIVAIFLFSIGVSAQEINWLTFEEAIALQKKEPKKIIMDFYAVWCGPCKMLDRYTFHNKDVANYINEHFYAVKFNAEGNDTIQFKERTFTNPDYDPRRAKTRNHPHELSRFFQINAYPSILFLDESGKKINKLVGFKTPQQLEFYLKMYANDDHLGEQSERQLRKEFKSEFN